MVVAINLSNKIVILEKLICKERKSYYKKLIEKNVGIVNVDFSLVRYLCKSLEINDININNCGYLTIKRKDNTVTTLGRFILEYYSKYDEKLKQLLENKEYEINHKNRNKLDNRLENLEIVTHKNNIRHSRGLDYEVLYSTEELKLLQVQNIKEDKQRIDKEFLDRIDGLFYKAMKKAIIEEKLLKCCYCYLEFKNIKNNSNNNTSNSRKENKIIDLERYKLMTNFCTNRLELLIRKKNKYICKTIIERDIRVLNRNIDRYSNIKEGLKKYKLVDKDFKEEDLKKEFLKRKFFKENNITELTKEQFEELKFEKSYSRNILLDFFKYIYDLNWYTIEDGNILVTVTLDNIFNVRGKYKAFHVLYLLGLLERQDNIYRPNNISMNDVHTPTFIKIPVYTDELLKEVNEISKRLLELNLNKITYSIIRDNFGIEKANSVYKDHKSKTRYTYHIKAKNDIINFLKTDKDIYIQGFMTKEEIFEQIEAINVQKAIKDESHIKVYKGFSRYIASLLQYDIDTKNVLEDLGLAYISLNTKTIQNIMKHQRNYSYRFKT